MCCMKRRHGKRFTINSIKIIINNSKKVIDEEPFHSDERRAQTYWYNVFKIIKDTISQYFNYGIYFTPKLLQKVTSRTTKYS